MKPLTFVTILMTILAGSAACAGSDYDACSREENRLRSEEADRCGGWSYVLNPSACFNARKALTPYDKGKCREFAPAEKIVGDKSPRQVIPAEGGAAVPAAARQPSPVPPVSVVGEKHSSEHAELWREIAGLRSEVERLKDEIARLKGGR